MLADRVEDCDPGAQNRCIFYGIDVLWNPNHGFRSEKNVFRISTVHGNAIDGFALAYLKKPPLAGLAGMVVALK